jgi:hypothetical protein
MRLRAGKPRWIAFQGDDEFFAAKRRRRTQKGSGPSCRLRRPGDPLRGRGWRAVPGFSQVRGDKSRFLAKAGFVPENGEVLLQALREQILPLEAVHLEKSEFGQLFEICGDLTGPSGRTLSVRTIWMTEGLSGRTEFITLTRR